MRVYRLSKRKYRDDLSGIGSEGSGSRWNSKGTRIIYTSDSMALSVLEVYVHVRFFIPDDFLLLHIEVPDTLKITPIQDKMLPMDWRNFPYSTSTQIIGDEFVAQRRSPILRVPSAIIPGEYNYLINPLHPDIKTIKIVKTEKFDFDQRLLGR